MYIYAIMSISPSMHQTFHYGRSKNENQSTYCAVIIFVGNNAVDVIWKFDILQSFSGY